MDSVGRNRFLRISNALVEALFRARLSGAQWRVLLWVIRQTHGWNRRSTLFTWYRVAKDVAMDRATAYRSGQALLRAGVLILADAQLGIQEDSENWGGGVLSLQAVDARQLWMPGMDVVRAQRKPLSGSNASVGKEQRLRCQETTLFRRAKDSSKDKSKTYKDRRRDADPRHHTARIEDTERQHLADATKPLRGKYDRLSQN